jgi:CheY-like chemotaxis protein
MTRDPRIDPQPARLVLIVDDDPVFVSQLTNILVGRGYLVLAAADGEAALDLLNQHELNFTLAIVDVFLPRSNGFELITRLSAPENKGNLKIIAVSTGRQKVLDIAISLGADAAMAKSPADAPLDAGQWLAEVFRQIGRPE